MSLSNSFSYQTLMSRSLDAFLELKLENERLHEELRELRIDLGEDPDDRSYLFPVPNAAGSSRPSNAGEAFSSRPQGGSGGSGGQLGLSGTTYHPDLTESESDSSSSSRSSSPDRKKPKEKKRPKKNSIATKEGEGMHVCVSCGRTDSPEWRKGPLGPKTLCNVGSSAAELDELTVRLAVCAGPSGTPPPLLVRRSERRSFQGPELGFWFGLRVVYRYVRDCR